MAARCLRARLDEAPDRPTLIALHHPPIPTGIDWLTENPDAEWVERLRAVVEGRPNIVALVAGHVHRTIITGWAGTTVIVCSSTAPQVALDLRPIDPERPDDTEIFGVDDFKESEVTIKARLKTVPIQQWSVGREYRRRLKKAFDASGIHFAFPTVQVAQGDDAGAAARQALELTKAKAAPEGA